LPETFQMMFAEPIGIDALATYIPEVRKSREEYAHLKPSAGPMWGEFPLEKRVCLRADAAEFQAVEASRRVLASGAVAAKDIDLVIAHTVGAQYIAPGIAAAIHRDLGLRREVPAWNLQEVCASFVDALHIATSLVTAHPGLYRRVLIVGVAAWHTGGWGVDVSDLSAVTVGDAAVAAVVSRDPRRARILAYGNVTASEIYDYIVTVPGAPQFPERIAEQQGMSPSKAIMQVAPQFPEWLLKVGRLLPSEILRPTAERAQVPLESVAAVCTHQATRSVLSLWADDLAPYGVPVDRWRHSYDRYGNCAAVDVGLNLAETLDDRSIAPGAVVALFGPGGAGHSAGMMLRVA
jgi:3-oxoacyl-[acyl-carrier-protein] synthase-3